MDLLVVCGLGVLINVMCHKTYSAPGMERLWEMDDAQTHLWNKYDVNGLSEDDRKLLCLARGRSIELILSLSMRYSTGIPRMPVQQLFVTILVNIGRMLCNYKWQADKKKTLCSPDFTIERLKIQLHAALALVIKRMDYLPRQKSSLTGMRGNGSFLCPRVLRKVYCHTLRELISKEVRHYHTSG